MRKYDELIEQVRLTDEARTRILKHIRVADALPAPMSGGRSWRSGLSAAACIALLLFGAMTIPPLFREEQPVEKPPVGGLLVKPQMVTASSAEELSELVGFPVEEPKGLPMENAAVTYTARAGTLAEIEYSTGDRTAVFRKSLGREDNSGRYNVYPVQEPFENGTYTGTLKGDADNRFVLAIWTDSEAAYSLYVPQGLSRREWMELIGE